ncbi:unnamed protein product, partial [marine sediment metagenome]
AMRAASAELKRHYTSGVDVTARSKTTDKLDALVDALEANPPLAEDLLGQVVTDHGVDMCDLALEEYLPDGIEPQDVYVTIRGKAVD